jgi:tRNA nucleotidyltransferase (CCA-adding enzyme)
MKEVFEKVLKKIKPEKEHYKEADEFIELINSLIKKNNTKAQCVAGGSYAKGTILKNDFDIDLFVRFDYSYKEEDLSVILEKILKPIKPQKVHGSRDYFQTKKNKLFFEIIPVLKIEKNSQALNVTDMSPLHVSYMKNKLKTQKLKDDIRLAKKFCKAAKTYGAESHIQGFSGHVLDILIAYYNGFENLLKQTSVWGDKVIIDIEKQLKNPEKELNKSKIQSPLIVVDPVDKNRNAAAAISKKSFEVFKKKAKEFLENPKQGFFKEKKLEKKQLKEKAGKEDLFILETKPLEGKDDIVGSKVLKVFDYIKKQLKINNFKVLESNWEYNKEKSILYYIVKKEVLSENFIREGPPVKVKKNAKNFREKHSNAYEKNGKLFAEEKRKYRKTKKLIKDLIKQDYVKEKVKKIKL